MLRLAYGMATAAVIAAGGVLLPAVSTATAAPSPRVTEAHAVPCIVPPSLAPPWGVPPGCNPSERPS